MNQITIIGNIVNDLEVKHTTNSQFCKFAVAVPRKRDKDTSDFFNLILWGKGADILMTYASKGDKLCFTGELHRNSYENSNGEKRVDYEIVVSDFEFIKTKKSEGRKAEAETAPDTEAETAKTAPDMENMDIDDLPFEI